MSELLAWFALPGAADWVAVFLCAIGLFTATLTAALGAGGGLLLLAVMSMFLPVGVTIPLHGVVQLGAALSRTALHWREVRLDIVAAFAVGAVAGAGAGSQVLVRLPEDALQVILGAFIVAFAWLRMPAIRARGSTILVACGAAATTFLTLFIGATGPLVASVLHALRMERFTHVGTFSACMILQHGSKVGVFVFAGFAFAPYLPFLAAMLLSALAGSWLGRHILSRIDDRRFHIGLSVVLTLMALRLLYTGLS